MTDQLDRLKTALSDRYTIERVLGRGGMAVVYLARDQKLNRHVALKVLRPELAVSLGGERFLREIEIAARLTHPNILALHDCGEADGHLFYTMPFVEGESLRDRLNREKQLSIHDALQITKEVADALGYAHSLGLVHRDIKPENILFEAGHAVVSDFGIARAVSEAGGETLTETGLSVGTPAYMSPEQAVASKDIDARTDIYSLGCVLYEMLSGETPHAAQTPQALIAKKLSEPTPRVSVVREKVPPAVEGALDRALSRTPVDRFVTAHEFSEALFVAPEHAERDIKSVAVLPFVNLSPDPDNEYFSDGMTEEIINALAHLEDLHVASRTSSFAFKGKSPEIAEVGAKLKVATVLEGSVRTSGDRLRITAQLIKVADGYHLWSERYDRCMEDVFDIQEEIAHAIVGALRVRLLGEATPLLRRGTHELEAYHLYLRGRHLWLQRGEGLRRCIPYFEQAIEKDPQYAQPHAGLADAYTILGFYGFVPSLDAYSKARTAAERAVALDDGLAEAHYSLGLCEWYFGWNVDAAASEFRRAIELDPSMALARVWLSVAYAVLGRVAESAAEAERAQELEPISPIINAMAGAAHYSGGRHVRAREAVQRALEIDPTLGVAHWVMGLAATAEAKYGDAVSAFESAALYTQRSPMMLVFLGTAYARSGRETDAREILGELQQQSERGGVSSGWAFSINFYLGELDIAFEQLGRAFEERFPIVWSVACGPGYVWPRSDARLVSLLDRPELKWLERAASSG